MGELIMGVNPDDEEYPIAIFWDEDSDDAFAMSLEEAKQFQVMLAKAIEDVEAFQAPKH